MDLFEFVQDEEDTEWILLNDRDEDDDLINEDSQNEEVRYFFYRQQHIVIGPSCLFESG